MQFVCAVCMQAMTHSVDNVPRQKTVKLVVVGRGLVEQCWFCVPFVFQGVSNFCSDTLFKLQNITLVINAVFRLERATEVLELTYRGKYFACVNAN